MKIRHFKNGYSMLTSDDGKMSLGKPRPRAEVEKKLQRLQAQRRLLVRQGKMPPSPDDGESPPPASPPSPNTSGS